MNKNEFLENLEKALKVIPYEERRKTIDYYAEMIDDAIEEGESEETVMERFSSVDETAQKIINDMPMSKTENESAVIKKLTHGKIICLIVCSPLWVPLLIAAIAIAVSLYVTMWAIAASLFVTAAAVALSALVLIFAAPSLISQSFARGMMFLGIALINLGLSVFIFYFALWCVKMLILLTKFCMKKIKALFVKRKGEKI